MARVADPPRELRPLLRFARLPAAGAAVIRRVLEADEEFRSRVAAAAEEDDVGRASWLFLQRPDGWEAELELLASEAAESDAAVDEAAAEERATRRLARATERVARLEADVAAVREELAAVRRARSAAGQRAAEAEAVRDALQQEVDRLRAEVARLEKQARAATAKPAPVPPPEPEPPQPAVDPAALRSALDAALAALGEALSLIPDDDPGPAPAPPPGERRPRRPKPPSGPRRQPIALPGGMHDDTPEAAEHLVRTNGVVVLVDGYNATISAWPDLSLSEQRTRLVDALAELVARTGADATVVFDGAHEPTASPRPARSPVRVLFSPPDVAADDVILQLVDATPVFRPVVVASDDRAVQDGAARRGANVLSRSQLLATLRRGAR